MLKKHILLAIFISFLVSCTTVTQPYPGRIHHTVFFSLKHPVGSAEEQDFLNSAKKLAAIPGVENFKVLKEVSPKNNFDFGFSMEFANQQMYDQYNDHPEHVAFVQQRWMEEVEDFMEIDYEVMK